MMDMSRHPESKQAARKAADPPLQAPENATDKPLKKLPRQSKAETTERDSPIGDETLARAIRGDDEALCTLLRILDRDLRYHVSQKIGARHRHEIEVDDVVQVTYMEAFLHIRRLQYRGQEEFRSWLWQIADNNIRDALRHIGAGRRPPPGKRITPEHRDDCYVDLLIQMGGTHSTPSKFMARKEAKRIMNEAIERLPSDYAAVVRLCDLDGQTACQAAVAMRRSEAAVRMLRARAHDRLAEIISSSIF